MADILGFPHGSQGNANSYPCDVEPPCEGDGNFKETLTQAPAFDPVERPAHYNQGPVETIEIIEYIISAYPNQAVAYNIGAALKYLCRAPYKHPTIAEDLKKALWHLTRAVSKLG